jgi:hypothetical protein
VRQDVSMLDTVRNNCLRDRCRGGLRCGLIQRQTACHLCAAPKSRSCANGKTCYTTFIRHGDAVSSTRPAGRSAARPARSNRDAEVPGSNPGAPTAEGHFLMEVSFFCCSIAAVKGRLGLPTRPPVARQPRWTARRSPRGAGWNPRSA